MSRTRVAAVRATPETILEDVRRVARLAGWPFSKALGEQLSVVLRGPEQPDQPGASSSPWILEGALRLVAETYRLGVSPPLIEVGRRGSVASSRLRPVLRGGQSLLPPQAAHLEGRDLLILAPLQLGGAWGVHAAITLAAETGSSWADASGRSGPQGAVETLACLYEHSRPRLWIVDGTVCGWRGGRSGHPTIQNLLLASSDPVALDATIARLMGLEPEQLPWLQGCAVAELGDISGTAIEAVGEPLDGLRLGPELDLNLVRSSVGGRGRRLPGWADRVLDRIARPPWVVRSRRRSYWRTPWGCLEKSYASGERP